MKERKGQKSISNVVVISLIWISCISEVDIINKGQRLELVILIFSQTPLV